MRSFDLALILAAAGSLFSRAGFSGGNVHFTRSEFADGAVSFDNARFSSPSHVNYFIAHFCGAQVSFRRQVLQRESRFQRQVCGSEVSAAPGSPAPRSAFRTPSSPAARSISAMLSTGLYRPHSAGQQTHRLKEYGFPGSKMLGPDSRSPVRWTPVCGQHAVCSAVGLCVIPGSLEMIVSSRRRSQSVVSGTPVASARRTAVRSGSGRGFRDADSSPDPVVLRTGEPQRAVGGDAHAQHGLRQVSVTRLSVFESGKYLSPTAT